ncbi:MAG: hypothetical protein HQL86_06935 [Magnetococcales bacterium]|nr:hypothetical protein [Magnetococcales bacterium]
MKAPSIIPIVERRLEKWGIWWTRAQEGGTGYSPSQTSTLLHRLMKQAPGTYSHRDLFTELSEEAQDAVAIESLLLDMEGFKDMERCAAAIRIRYAGRGTNQEKAAELGVSVEMFYDRLKTGVIWIASATRHEAKHSKAALKDG